jgi:hypothetical protein
MQESAVESTDDVQWSWPAVLRLLIATCCAVSIASEWVVDRQPLADQLGMTALAIGLFIGPNLLIALGFLYQNRFAYYVAVLTDCTIMAFCFGFVIGLDPSPVKYSDYFYIAIFGVMVIEGLSLTRKITTRTSRYLIFYSLTAIICGSGWWIAHIYGPQI